MVKALFWALIIGANFLYVASHGCGKPPITPNLNTSVNIIGGTVAVPFSWPWQVRLTIDDSIGCAGSVIGSKWILSAGHCVTGMYDPNVVSPEEIRIYTGRFNLSVTDEAGGKTFEVKKIYRHPKFFMNITDLIYDMSLLELTKEITFDKHTQPVCLPLEDANVVVEPNGAWVTGWGDTEEGAREVSFVLKQANVPFVNYGTCRKEYPHWVEKDTMICAGSDTNNPCHGDSGGPLVAENDKNVWFQYGIVSGGNANCTNHEHPGVFTRVSAFCDFIKTTTQGEVECQKP